MKVQVLEAKIISLEDQLKRIEGRIWALMFVSFTTLVGVIVK